MSDLEHETPALGIKTKYPPCCLQLNANATTVLVGTYDLIKETGKRYGTIERYDLIQSEDQPPNLELKEEVLNISDDVEVRMPAILDLKIIRQFEEDDVISFVTCHSTGCLNFWIYNKFDNKIFHKNNIQVTDDDSILLTSLHIKNTTQDTSTLKILCTATDGSAALVTINNGNGEESIEFIQDNHGLECWTAEFGDGNCFDQCFFTGGDDATIKLFDTRVGLDSAIWSNSRVHDAGIVSLKTNASSNSGKNGKTYSSGNENSILSGSYDDTLQVNDLRMIGSQIYPGLVKPILKESKNLEGGVWRLIDTEESDELLVCCMYNGAKIVKVDYDTEPVFTEKNYVKEGHDSMCYGGDYRNKTAATCSFYDNSLQVWKK
ncbi:hypothetical protein FOG48_02504 [Hanseniaspora uvarum]|nr:hypothetical protein FOG48_02504 [Hanseniaspora uvarum]